VLRGGSWTNPLDDTRAAFRNGDLPGGRLDRVGVRLVCGVPISQKL
jgi:formylglycine-generating enzyme required for sulfatase activity